MDHNDESLRRKFLGQHQSPTAKPQQSKFNPPNKPTFDQKFRSFTAKVDDRLKNVAISLIIGGLIGWLFLATLGNLAVFGLHWIVNIAIWIASCGAVYWYLRRSES